MSPRGPTRGTRAIVGSSIGLHAPPWAHAKCYARCGVIRGITCDLTGLHGDRPQRQENTHAGDTGTRRTCREWGHTAATQPPRPTPPATPPMSPTVLWKSSIVNSVKPWATNSSLLRAEISLKLWDKGVALSDGWGGGGDTGGGMWGQQHPPLQLLAVLQQRLQVSEAEGAVEAVPIRPRFADVGVLLQEVLGTEGTRKGREGTEGTWERWGCQGDGKGWVRGAWGHQGDPEGKWRRGRGGVKTHQRETGTSRGRGGTQRDMGTPKGDTRTSKGTQRPQGDMRTHQGDMRTRQKDVGMPRGHEDIQRDMETPRGHEDIQRGHEDMLKGCRDIEGTPKGHEETQRGREDSLEDTSTPWVT